jgi:multidrug efflux pump subunit AcrA (membrane-fusion protein)
MSLPRWMAAIAVLAVVTGCSAPSTSVTAVGTVVDDPTVVSVPILSDSAPTKRVDKVLVAEGDTVRAGQEVARIDDAVLLAQIEVARAGQKVAESQVGVLTAAIGKTYDKAADVSDARADVKDAISKLKSTRAQLVRTQAQLKKTRAQLVTKLQSAQKLLANYPPVPVPGIPSKDELKAGIAQLQAGIAKIDAGLKKIVVALPTLSEGLKKADDGLAKLADADAKISDARQQLVDARELARIGAEASAIPVSLAQLQVTLATVTSPVDGTVLSVAAVGDQLAPGATLARIRTDEPSTVTAWLAPDQLGRVCEGDATTITGDWMPAGTTMGATLTRIGTELVYPPSNTTTDEVHLTRAVEVQVTATGILPAGVPVELSISGCRS